MFLTDVLEKPFSTKFERSGIPEFPLRLGTLWPETERKDRNRSVKVDYVVFAKDYKRAFFVELKTSMKSRNSDRDSYLKRAAGLEFKALLEGVRCLRVRWTACGPVRSGAACQRSIQPPQRIDQHPAFLERSAAKVRHEQWLRDRAPSTSGR